MGDPPRPSPAPRPCRAGGEAQLSPHWSSALAPPRERTQAVKWSGPDTIPASCGHRGLLQQACHRESSPRGSGNSSRAAKNQLYLKIQKIYKNQFRNLFSPPQQNIKTKGKKGGERECVGSPPLQRNPWHTAGAGEELGAGELFYQVISRLWGRELGEEGRRLLGVGVRMLRTSAPGCRPKRPPRIPPLCKSKPFPPRKAATRIAQCKADCHDNSAGGHAGSAPSRGAAGANSPRRAGKGQDLGQRLRL